MSEAENVYIESDGLHITVGLRFLPMRTGVDITTDVMGIATSFVAKGSISPQDAGSLIPHLSYECLDCKFKCNGVYDMQEHQRHPDFKHKWRRLWKWK